MLYIPSFSVSFRLNRKARMKSVKIESFSPYFS